MLILKIIKFIEIFLFYIYKIHLILLNTYLLRIKNFFSLFDIIIKIIEFIILFQNKISFHSFLK